MIREQNKFDREQKERLQAEREKKIQQAKEWFEFGFSKCWHCGGKRGGGIFGNFWKSPCKVCGKSLSECFLCGGEIIEYDFRHSNGCKSFKCLRCGEDFGLLGFK